MAVLALGLLALVGCSREKPPRSPGYRKGASRPLTSVLLKKGAHLVGDPVSAVREALPADWEILKTKEGVHPPCRPLGRGHALFLGRVGRKYPKIPYGAALYIMPPDYEDGGVDPLHGRIEMTGPAALIAITADARLYLWGNDWVTDSQGIPAGTLRDLLRESLIVPSSD